MADDDINALEGMTEESFAALGGLMNENLEVVESAPDTEAVLAAESLPAEEEAEEEYECPECGRITSYNVCYTKLLRNAFLIELVRELEHRIN